MSTQSERFPFEEPMLDTETITLLMSLRQELPADRIPGLKAQIAAHLEQVRRHHGQNEFLDIDLARRIAEALNDLLDTYVAFSPDHQQLVVAAVRYFTDMDDAEPDVSSIFGLDDDARVLNFVLTQVGLPEYRIEL